MTLTREIAQAAGWDAANRAMRAGGRKAWSEEDANIAWREFGRLWPLCTHKVERDCCPFRGCMNSIFTNDDE
ncbi:MAG TPA: hypothetical protein VFC37_07990 [Terracidiphilus sp.]|nr:hypothetical protein [Terracidiphilus sp.]